jgi:hypothetical protein
MGEKNFLEEKIGSKKIFLPQNCFPINYDLFKKILVLNLIPK